MRFVNLQPSSLIPPTDRRRPGILEDVLLLLWRVPEPRIVNRRDGKVLGDTGDPGWKAVDGRSVWFGEFDLGEGNGVGVVVL
jgi:hypothetical protein